MECTVKIFARDILETQRLGPDVRHFRVKVQSRPWFEKGTENKHCMFGGLNLIIELKYEKVGLSHTKYKQKVTSLFRVKLRISGV